MLIPGDAVEVFLKSKAIPNALAVPVHALIEGQGKFYVYVQVAGESFAKRPVTLGAQDGSSAQIISGVKAGERIVTKGVETRYFYDAINKSLEAEKELRTSIARLNKFKL